MTHTLNRTGLSEARPGEEFVVLCMAHRPNKAGKAEAMKQIAATILKHKPENIIGRPIGFSDEVIPEMVPLTGVVTAVFTKKEDALKVIEEIKIRLIIIESRILKCRITLIFMYIIKIEH